MYTISRKLAAVLRKQATTKLLATHDAERLPIGRLVSEQSGAATDERGLFSTKESFGTALAMIRKQPRMNGYGYSYASRAINMEDTTPLVWTQRWHMPSIPWIFSAGGVPGTRALHIWVQREGRQISTLEKGFILLASPKEINGTKPARMLLTTWVSSCSRTVLDQPVTLFVLELNLSQQHGFQKLEHYLFA